MVNRNDDDAHITFEENLAMAGEVMNSRYEHLSFEQKLAEASWIIKEAAAQLNDTGMKLDFEIRITAQRPGVGVSFITESGKNPPPSK